MILCDTSYWIEFLKGNERIHQSMESWLNEANIFAFSPIFGELLQGCRNKREIRIIRSYWKDLPKVNETDVWIEAGNLSYQYKLYNQGLGLIDASILAISLKYRLELYSYDKKLMTQYHTLHTP